MIHIEDIGERVASGTIDLGGATAHVRMLTCAEDAWARAALPAPADKDGPAFARWALRMAALELAIAARLVVPEGGDAQRGYDPLWAARWHTQAAADADADARADAPPGAGWAARAADALLGAVTRADLEQAHAELRRLHRGAVARAYAELVGESGEELDDEERTALDVDPEAPPSELRLALRVCERFGVDPMSGWWEQLTTGTRAVLLAYEAVRQREGRG